MWSQERHQRILAILESNRQVNAGDLSQLLGVSRETIRRDLLQMELSGQVNRVHGGAVLSAAEPEAPFERRKHSQVRAKAEIARKAVKLIGPGASLFVDAGTTTSALGQELAKLSGIMVVTNSLDIATTVKAAGSDIDLLLLGGRIGSDVPATRGELTLTEIRRFHLDLAIVSPVSLDAEKGAFSYDLHEAEIAGAMIAQSRKSILLADHTKLGTTNRVQLCDIGQIGVLVTDRKSPKGQLKSFSQRGVEVMA